MGGMALIIDKSKCGQATDENLKKMLAHVAHRGADIQGLWHTEDCNLGFADCRYSLIENTKEHFKLPFWNEEKTVAVIVTGRIYNAYELRLEFEKLGHVFLTGIDSEVIIHGYEEIGTEILRKIEGMFSIAIIDLRYQQIVLARDGFGKKPLYYLNNENFFALGSEMQAFLCGFPGPGAWKCDYNGLSDYLIFGHNIRERTIVQNVKRVLPGEAIVVSFSGDVVQRWRYWLLPSVNPFFQGGAEEAYEQFKMRFENAVTHHFENSVGQVDLLLSGGVDSAAILCAANELGFIPNVYTLAVKDQDDDGSLNAMRLTEALGLQLKLTTLDSPATASDFIETMNCFDEPFCNPNALGLRLICKTLESENRKTAVVGDGGNELMLGFQHFHDYAAGRSGQLYGLASNCNDFLRNISTMHNLAGNWAHFFCEQMGRVPTPQRRKLFVENFNELNDATIYTIFDSMFDQQGRSPYDFLARFDYLFELPDEVMMRLDRISSNAHCELRTPYIDRDLAGFMVSLPEELHFGMGKDIKWMIHRYMQESLNNEPLVNSIIETRRQGFPLPVDAIMHTLWDDGMAMWLLEDDFLWWTSLRREGVEEIMSKKNNKNGISRAALTLFSLYLWWRKVICNRPVSLI